MIVARFKVVQSDTHERRLVGRTTSGWSLAVGTQLVLKRDGDEYVLLELGERKCATPSDEMLASFVDDVDERD